MVRVSEAIDDNIIRGMRIAWWFTNATDTHSEYVILLAFAQRQWLGQRALRVCLYVHCLSYYKTRRLIFYKIWYERLDTRPCAFKFPT